jgi:hypothetical protein
MAKVIPLKPTPDKRDATREKQSRRRSWEHALTIAKRTQAARQLVPADYAWLRRHDRAWLDESLPARSSKPHSCVRRVDWTAREGIYLAKLGDAYISLVNRRPFQHCSTMALAKEVGADRTLKFLDKMPRLRRELSKLVEDTQRFALRRLTAVHQTSTHRMTASQLRKAAGIRSSITKIPTVKKHIDFLLQKSPRT